MTSGVISGKLKKNEHSIKEAMGGVLSPKSQTPGARGGARAAGFKGRSGKKCLEIAMDKENQAAWGRQCSILGKIGKGWTRGTRIWGRAPGKGFFWGGSRKCVEEKKKKSNFGKSFERRGMEK